MITYINDTTMKKFARKKCPKMFLEVNGFFFRIRELFLEFQYKIFVITLHDIVGLKKFLIVFLPNIIQNYDALVLHLNWTALSQSESSYFFMGDFTIERAHSTSSIWNQALHRLGI